MEFRLNLIIFFFSKMVDCTNIATCIKYAFHKVYNVYFKDIWYGVYLKKMHEVNDL